MHYFEFLEENINSPKLRDQKWIFQSRESPLNNRISTFFDDKIDTTFIYHHTSDISFSWGLYIHYGKYQSLPFYLPPKTSAEGKQYLEQLEKQKEEQQYLYRILLKSKKKQTLWYVSNCNAKHRNKYGADLKEAGISIDKYGRCGVKDPCLKSPNVLKCTRQMFLTYKFYLAFENSLCEDYITEKCWKCLKEGMLPVVMGPSIKNYDHLLPPNSFLHVSNFSNAEELASYIKYLDSDDEAYMRYHLWREKYQVIMINDNHFLWKCEMCKRMYLPPKTVQGGLSKWFTPQIQCNIFKS